MDNERITLIDTDADIEGKLKGKDARILGRFRGDIELAGRLHVGESARVDAKVQADAAEIAGEFKGELVSRSLLLLEKARVTGTLDAQSLAVREGAQLNGAINASGAHGGARPKPAPPAAAPAAPPKPAAPGTASG